MIAGTCVSHHRYHYNDAIVRNFANETGSFNSALVYAQNTVAEPSSSPYQIIEAMSISAKAIDSLGHPGTALRIWKLALSGSKGTNYDTTDIYRGIADAGLAVCTTTSMANELCNVTEVVYFSRLALNEIVGPRNLSGILSWKDLLRRQTPGFIQTHDALRPVAMLEKVQHDLEQIKYITEKDEVERRNKHNWRLFVSSLLKLSDLLTSMVSRGSLSWEYFESQLDAKLPASERNALARGYGRIMHLAKDPVMLMPTALRDTLDGQAITTEFFESGGIAVIDDILSTEALTSLRKTAGESIIWHDARETYLGAYANNGLLTETAIRIAMELGRLLPRVICGRRLRQLWAYKFSSSGNRNKRLSQSGIDLHADDALVSVNIWVQGGSNEAGENESESEDTTDKSSSGGGGLLIYPEHRSDTSETFKQYNKQPKRIRSKLTQAGAKARRIAHRINRAVVFDSSLYHESDAGSASSYGRGVHGRRINYTFLFGQPSANGSSKKQARSHAHLHAVMSSKDVEITVVDGGDSNTSRSISDRVHSSNKSMNKLKDYMGANHRRFSMRMSSHFLHTQRVILAESKKEKHSSAGDRETVGHEAKGTFGSRNVGGQMPTNQEMHDSIESFDYSYKDTVEGALMARVMSRPDPLFKCCSRGCSRRAVMWFLYALIGVTVSLLVTGVLAIEGEVLKLRVYAAKDLLKSGDLGLAWLSWTGSSLVLCMIACTCVLIEPAAASSGIPGLIAFLNGVQPKGGHSPLTKKTTSFTSWQTMIAKSIGMVASVPSGLCVGPEGPIIHVSALMAHYTCVIFQKLEQRLFPGHRFTAQASEARDFLATGAACGICTAFRAPIAGVMFVVEEAASFFTTQHLEYTFVASLMAYWITWSLTAYNTGESTVKFKQTSGSFCTYHDMLDYFFFVVIGIVGGITGSAFNQIVEHLNHLRVHHINHFAWRRMAEVVIVCLLTGTIAVYLPSAFSCKPQLRGIMMEDSAGCLNAGDTFQISGGAVSHTFLSQLLEQSNNSNCSAVGLNGGAGGSSRRMLLASDSKSASSSAAVPIPQMGKRSP
eukprot:g1293.t1